MKHRDINILWPKLLEHCLSFGDNNTATKGVTKELVGYSFELTNPMYNFLTNPIRKLPPHYPCGELVWYLTMGGSIDFIAAYAKKYRRYDEGDGTAYGAYGTRIANNPGFKQERLMTEFEEVGVWAPQGGPSPNQIRWALRLLQERPSTRQCVVALWDSGDLVHALNRDKKDLPCTTTIQFLIRKRRLHCVVNMRSNDLWLGVPNDVFCFSTLQIIVAMCLGLDVGHYYHNVGSLHLYDYNFDQARAACVHGETMSGHGWDSLPNYDNDPVRAFDTFCRDITNLESHGRESYQHEEESMERLTAKEARVSQSLVRNNSVMNDILECCYMKTVKDFVPDMLFSPRLRAGAGLNPER